MALEESRQQRDVLSHERDTTGARVETLDEAIKNKEMQLSVMGKEEDGFNQVLQELEKKTQTIRMEQVAEGEENARIEEEAHAARGRLHTSPCPFT